MSIAAEIINRAVDELRRRADRATDGPWVAAPVHSPNSPATSAVYSHAYPTGTVHSEVVAAGRVRVGYGGIRHAPNAEYIELVHPPVGHAIAALLEREAGEAIGEYGAALAVGESIDRVNEIQARRYAETIRLAKEILREGVET